MRYTILWTPAAERQLAQIWVEATDRAAVTRAAKGLDELLRDDAHLRGESRDGNQRIVFLPPLGCYFDAIEPDRLVYVLAVWHV